MCIPGTPCWCVYKICCSAKGQVLFWSFLMSAAYFAAAYVLREWVFPVLNGMAESEIIAIIPPIQNLALKWIPEVKLYFYTALGYCAIGLFGLLGAIFMWSFALWIYLIYLLIDWGFNAWQLYLEVKAILAAESLLIEACDKVGALFGGKCDGLDTKLREYIFVACGVILLLHGITAIAVIILLCRIHSDKKKAARKSRTPDPEKGGGSDTGTASGSESSDGGSKKSKTEKSLPHRRRSHAEWQQKLASLPKGRTLRVAKQPRRPRRKFVLPEGEVAESDEGESYPLATMGRTPARQEALPSIDSDDSGEHDPGWDSSGEEELRHSDDDVPLAKANSEQSTRRQSLQTVGDIRPQSRQSVASVRRRGSSSSSTESV